MKEKGRKDIRLRKRSPRVAALGAGYHFDDPSPYFAGLFIQGFHAITVYFTCVCYNDTVV
jgi:hypothetical protein